MKQQVARIGQETYRTHTAEFRSVQTCEKARMNVLPLAGFIDGHAYDEKCVARQGDIQGSELELSQIFHYKTAEEAVDALLAGKVSDHKRPRTTKGNGIVLVQSPEAKLSLLPSSACFFGRFEVNVQATTNRPHHFFPG